MVSYMRLYTSNCADLTYGRFIIVHSAWGVAQGIVLPLAGLIVDAVGNNAAVIVGSALFAAAPVLTAASAIDESLGKVVITFGVTSAIGQNLALLPTLTVPMSRFSAERKGLVVGTVVSGFGLGAFVFNPIQTRLANPENFPVNRASGYFTEKRVLNRVPETLRVLGMIYACILTLGTILLLRTMKRNKKKQAEKNKKISFRSAATILANFFLNLRLQRQQKDRKVTGWQKVCSFIRNRFYLQRHLTGWHGCQTFGSS